MEHIKDIENVQNIQALRISGALYLLKKNTGFNVFDESKMKINEDCFVEYIRKQKLPSVLEERFQYYAQKNKTENMGYHEGLLYKHIKKFLKSEISENDFLLKINNLLSEEKAYLETMQFQGFDFPEFKRDFQIKSFEKLKKHKKMESHFILAPKPKTSIFKRKKKLLLLDGEKIVKGSNVKIPKKELCLKEEECFGSNLMTGVTGSGLLRAGLSLFAQNLWKGNGGFYFTSGYNFEAEALHSVARSLNREDDFLFVNLSSFRKIFSFDFKDAIQNNKIIVFTGSNNSNTRINMSNFADELMQFLFLKIQNVSLKEQGFMLMFHNVLNFFSLNEDLFCVLNKLLKEKKLTGVFLEFSEFIMEENMLDFMEKHMENHLVFRQEYGLVEFLDDEIKQVAGDLNVGEFLFLKSLKNKKTNKDLEKYLSYYHDDMKSRDIYETMF